MVYPAIPQSMQPIQPTSDRLCTCYLRWTAGSHQGPGPRSFACRSWQANHPSPDQTLRSQPLVPPNLGGYGPGSRLHLLCTLRLHPGTLRSSVAENQQTSHDPARRCRAVDPPVGPPRWCKGLGGHDLSSAWGIAKQSRNDGP